MAAPVEPNLCGICYNDLERDGLMAAHPHAVQEAHRHICHRVCLERWIEQRRRQGQQPNCPLCNVPIQIIHANQGNPQHQADEAPENFWRLGLFNRVVQTVSNLLSGWLGSSIGYCLVTQTAINPPVIALCLGFNILDLAVKSYFGNVDIIDELFKILENQLWGLGIGLAMGCIQICIVITYDFYYRHIVTYMSKLAYAKEQIALASAQFDLPRLAFLRIDPQKFTAYFFSHEVSLEKLLAAFPNNIAWNQHPIIDFINTKPFSLFYHVKDAFAFTFSLEGWKAPIIAPFKMWDLSGVAGLLGGEATMIMGLVHQDDDL